MQLPALLSAALALQLQPVEPPALLRLTKQNETLLVQQGFGAIGVGESDAHAEQAAHDGPAPLLPVGYLRPTEHDETLLVQQAFGDDPHGGGDSHDAAEQPAEEGDSPAEEGDSHPAPAPHDAGPMDAHPHDPEVPFAHSDHDLTYDGPDPENPKHPDHGQPEEDGEDGDFHQYHGEPKDSSGAAACAVGLFATTIFIPWVFSMTQSGAGEVSKLTWKFIDFFVSVFLAILWFGAFHDLIDQSGRGGLVPRVAIASLQVVVLYCVALLVAYLFSDNKFRLLTFASCAAHYIAFSGIAAGDRAQRKYFSDEPYEPVVFVGCAFVFLVGLFVATYSLRMGKGSNGYNAAIDELELDFAGLVLSYLVTQSVRTALTGHYPAPHFLQASPAEHVLVAGVHGEDGVPLHGHSAFERNMMLVYALTGVVGCIVFLPRLYSESHHGTWRRKFHHLLKVLMIMCSAWGLLLWGEWEFHQYLFADEGMFGTMLFAFIATAGCLTTVFVVGSLVSEEREQVEAAELGCTGLGLVAAWAWEHCFHQALEVVAEQYQVGYGGLVPKLVLAIGVPCFILPVYVHYVKPNTLDEYNEALEELEEDEKEEAEEAKRHKRGQAKAKKEAVGSA